MKLDVSNQGTRAIPLILGVTGHRLMREGTEDTHRIEELVRGVLDEFRRKYPNTPAILLSPMAKGADRLVARVAMESTYKDWCSLVVPMPLPEAEYRKDFQNDGSEQEFDTLLKKAGIEPGIVSGRLFPVPLLPGADVADAGARDRQYAVVGQFVAYHSQVLIALWDGQVSSDPAACGTDGVVNFKLQSGAYPELTRLTGEPWLPLMRPLDMGQAGPVYHIRVPRENESFPANEIKMVRIYSGAGERVDAQERTRFEKAYRQIEQLNKCCQGPTDCASTETLLPEPMVHNFGPNSGAINSYYRTASSKALFFQEKTRGTLFSVSVLVFVGTIFFTLKQQQLALDGCANFMSYGYYTCVGGCVALLAYSKLGRLQDHYQDYRALAEGLRIQFFWRLAGIKNWVSHYYFSKQKSDMEWIRTAINNCNLASYFFTSEPQPFASRAPRTIEVQNIVEQHWVSNQVSYFERVLARDRRELINLTNVGEGLIVFASLLAAVCLRHPKAANSSLRVLIGGLMLSLIPVVAHFALKQGRQFCDHLREGSSPWPDLLKVGTGFAAGMVICCLIFDLSVFLPGFFESWELLPWWMPPLGGIAAYLLIVDGVFQFKSCRRSVSASKNLLIGIEQCLIYFWPVLAAIELLVISLQPSRPPMPLDAHSLDREDVYVVVILVTAALGAILNFYAEKKALVAHLRESERMRRLFQRAAAILERRLYQPDDPDDPIKDLGLEALLENTTWLLTHRERPLEMPKAN